MFFHALSENFKEQWGEKEDKPTAFKRYWFEISWHLNLLHGKTISLSKQI